MDEIIVLGVYVKNRAGISKQIQQIFTTFGCSIRTRLGLNLSDGEQMNEEGLILLELTGDRQEMLKLENALLKLDDVQVKKMVFRRHY